MDSLNSKYAIALHTSTPQLGIAINNYAGFSRDRLWDLGRGLYRSQINCDRSGYSLSVILKNKTLS